MIIVCRFEDCPAYSDVDQPLKVVEERERSVLYVCRTCLRGRLVTKDKCGGTVGAGAKEDGRRSVVGKGF